MQAFEEGSTQSLEASVASILIKRPDLIDEVKPIINNDCFSDPTLKMVYEWIVAGQEAGRPIGSDVLMQRLANHTPDGGDPTEYVSWLYYYQGDMLDVQYPTVLKQKALALANAWKSNQARHIINRISLTPGSAADDIKTLIDGLSVLQSSGQGTARSIGSIVQDNKDNYFKQRKPFHKLGLHRMLDAQVFLEGGDVVVIGARPAVGKSALVQQVALNLVEQGMRVGFFSLEMTEAQTYQRLMASLSGFDMNMIRTRCNDLNWSEQQIWDTANAKLTKIGQKLFYHFGSTTVPEIRQTVKQMGYDVIIVDYLQLIKATDRYKGARVAEVGEISKGLKAIAMDMDIPVILLSQLNRGAEYSESKEPTMADLRESGDIEQDASIVMLLWNLDESRTKKALKVDKNRMGECLTVVLSFDGKQMRFKETTLSVNDFREPKEEKGNQKRGQANFNKSSSDGFVKVKQEDKESWER